MSSRIYFVQGCPICGRRLNIRLEYLGRRVVCQHCGGQFLAKDPANGPVPNGQTVHQPQMLLDNPSKSSPPEQFPHPR